MEDSCWPRWQCEDSWPGQTTSELSLLRSPTPPTSGSCSRCPLVLSVTPFLAEGYLVTSEAQALLFPGLHLGYSSYHLDTCFPMT